MVFMIDAISSMGRLWHAEAELKECGTTKIVSHYHRVIYKISFVSMNVVECCLCYSGLLFSLRSEVTAGNHLAALYDLWCCE